MDSQDEKIRKTTTKVNTKMVVGQSGEVLLAYFLVVWSERILSYLFALFYDVDPELHFRVLYTGQEGWTGDAVFGVYLLPPVILAFTGIAVVESWKWWMKWKFLPHSFVFWMGALASSRALLGGAVGAFSSAELGYVYTWAFVPKAVQYALSGTLFGIYLLFLTRIRLALLAMSPFKNGIKNDYLRTRYTWTGFTVPLLAPFAFSVLLALLFGNYNETYFTGLWVVLGFIMLRMNNLSSPQYHFIRRYHQKLGMKWGIWAGVALAMATSVLMH